MHGLTIKIVYKQGMKSLPPNPFSQSPSILRESENVASDLGIFLIYAMHIQGSLPVFSRPLKKIFLLAY